jgi:hypothetical protein
MLTCLASLFLTITGFDLIGVIPAKPLWPSRTTSSTRAFASALDDPDLASSPSSSPSAPTFLLAPSCLLRQTSQHQSSAPTGNTTLETTATLLSQTPDPHPPQALPSRVLSRLPICPAASTSMMTAGRVRLLLTPRGLLWCPCVSRGSDLVLLTRALTTIASPPSLDADMPIVRSEPNALGLDDEDEKR